MYLLLSDELLMMSFASSLCVSIMSDVVLTLIYLRYTDVATSPTSLFMVVDAVTTSVGGIFFLNSDFRNF